jgi:hypothetical protein
MTVRATVFMIQAAILLAWPAPALPLDPSSAADAMHEKVTRNLISYHSARRSKALAACVNWEASSIFNPNVRHLQYFATGDKHKGDVPSDKLLKMAVNACGKLRQENDSNCECVPIDMNGQSVLELPPSFLATQQASIAMQKLTPAAGPTPLEADVPKAPGPMAQDVLPDPRQSMPSAAAPRLALRQDAGDQRAPKFGAVAIQNLLAALGYDPGPIDGFPNLKTESAIRAFQSKHGVAVDGRLSGELLVLLSEVVRTRRR